MPDLCSNGDGRRAYRHGVCQRCYRAPDGPRVLARVGLEEPAVKVSVRIPIDHAEAVQRLSRGRLSVWLREAIIAKIRSQDPELGL